MGEGLALITAACFALYNILVKKGMAGGDKDLGILVTLIINNIVNCIALTALNSWTALIRLPWPAVLFFCGAGLFTSFLGRTFLFNSIERIGPSRAGTFKVAAPAYTVLIGVFILGETLSVSDLAGILITLGGLWFVSRQPASKDQVFPVECRAVGSRTEGQVLPGNRVSRKKLFWGIALGVLSGLFFSTGNVFRKVGMNIVNAPVEGTAIGSLAAIAVFAVFLLANRKLNRSEWARLLPAAKYYAVAGLLSSIGIFSFFFSLRSTPVSVANVIASAEPLFLVAFSFFWLRKQEAIGLKLVTGALCCVCGVALIAW